MAGPPHSAPGTHAWPGAAQARPVSAAETADLLRGTRGTVLPVGAGTKTGWAAPPASCDLVLHTGGLARVTEYLPGDLVVVAEAGVPLGSLRQLLAEHGQMLALDPPEAGATLGGIVSANASGPRRLRYGTVRDLLIGVTVVLADGTVARAGGKVVKNVAGYDLGKLYTGAHGALGVVVSTTWRLHPLPPARATVTLPVDDSEHAGRCAARLARSTLTPTAAELRWDGAGAGGELAVLFESTAASVRAQARDAVTLLGGGSTGEEPPRWFGRRPEGETVLRLAYAPSALPRVLDALDALPGGPARGTASACTGVAYAAVPPGTDLAALRAALAPYDGSAVVLGGPLTGAGSAPARTAAEHWGPTGDSFPLMTRVKDRFDPERRLSPGRLLGGL
ncbi:glycolate oxidase FAD binding subunit [Actinacidiphila rubida]|uniref:Glycolate oxidase FAD binding subunit n=1 Tax=Actinacidiphila rubida TaxID=310780 RepID=A0A1H8KYI8_9ACTN|nr:FAD-binding oxidoreductase [Actinacidiphila rubida]SEN97478.1 glycolate oxidase FAD binding subunit [Actinacidiphila rubida]